MAGRAYGVSDTQAVTTPADSILHIQGSATVQGYIFYIAFSILTDELDDMIQWTVQRFDTADGTFDDISADVVEFRDSSIGTQMTAVGGNHSAEPGYVATEVLLDIAVNTRSFQQFYAQPGREFETAAGANEGIGIAPLHGSSTPSALCTLHWTE